MSRLLALLLLPLATLLIGAVYGAMFNATNAAVSGEYFAIVLGRGRPWTVTSPQAVALLHGLAEGGIGGLIFGVLFAGFVAAVGGRWAGWRQLVRPTALGLAAAAVCMAVFGLCGMLWAWASPQSYVGTFPIAFRATNLPAFGWVGGSIWGAYAGVVVAVIVASAAYARVQRRLVEEGRGFAVDG